MTAGSPDGHPPGTIFPAAGRVQLAIVLMVTHAALDPRKITKKFRLEPIVEAGAGDVRRDGHVLTETLWILSRKIAGNTHDEQLVEAVNAELRTILRSLLA
jgi:hypothetical protein